MKAFLAMLLAVGVLFGCGLTEAIPKIGKVIADPKIPVGDKNEQPSEISIHAYAAADVNRNFDGEPSPVIIRVYALTSDHRLFGLDFFTIVSDPKEAFGVTLLEVLDESMLAPDSYKILGPYKLPKNTKKIGIVAEYLDIDTSVWRGSIDVNSIGSDDRLLLLLLEEELRLLTESD